MFYNFDFKIVMFRGMVFVVWSVVLLNVAFPSCINEKLRYEQLLFKNVRANCFCTALLRTQIHIPRHP